MAALDDRVAVAIQATRKLSVEIMMIIDVPDFGAITALHGKRERIRIKDGARVSTREERLCR
jgi:hypothetical protein